MKTKLLAVLLVVGLAVSAATADSFSMNFLPTKDAGITTLGEHTNRGGDSQISFCNGTADSGEFGIFDFDRAAIQGFITTQLNGLSLLDAINLGRIAVNFSLVASFNDFNPDLEVGLMSVYTGDNWVEGTGASGLGNTTPYNWPGAATGATACTAASPNDSIGSGANWHRSDTGAAGQQLQNIPGVSNSETMSGWAMNVRTSIMLDDVLWFSYIYGIDAADASIVPASTMLKTYGLGVSSSPMTCYTKEAGADYAPMLTVTIVRNQILPPEPPHAGDANNDGLVNVVDLGVLAKNYDRTGLPVSQTDRWNLGSWQLADFNNDGNVDVVDLGILSKNYDWSGAPILPAPEPATLSLLALGGLTMLRRRA